MSTKTDRRRTPEEAISYALGHRFRIEILCLLNERSYSVQELSRTLRVPIGTVTHHVEALLGDDRIEVAETKRVRNLTQNYYRAIELPLLSDEEMAALPPKNRQEIYGVILQAAMAESLASYSTEKIRDDQRAVLAWMWLNADAQARVEIADEQARSLERMREINAASASRRAQSGEDGKSIVVVSFGFERSRTAGEPPPHARSSPDVR